MLSGRAPAGGGRKTAVAQDATLLSDLGALVEPTSRGDPQSPLRWTCKSVRRLAEELQAQGHRVGRTLVSTLLDSMGYSLQGNRKTREGDSHPDRNAQFEYINGAVGAALAERQPVISVDTKKKELVGDFKNSGREYRPEGDPEKVRVHDFLIKELGRAVPYGVYDLAANAGWVNLGIDHDTAAFAVQSIRRWWQEIGRTRYPNATRLLITADGGGSNGSRVRLWKHELQKLANELDSTSPSATCRRAPASGTRSSTASSRTSARTGALNRSSAIGHRRPDLCDDHQDRPHRALRDRRDPLPKGITVSDAEMAAINITRHDFHGEWNYTISPLVPPNRAFIL